MATRYWVGGTGTWDNSSTTNWSATSGGSSGASAPGASDDVVFDANSDTGSSFTVTLAGGAIAPTISIRSLTASALDKTLYIANYYDPTFYYSKLVISGGDITWGTNANFSSISSPWQNSSDPKLFFGGTGTIYCNGGNLNASIRISGTLVLLQNYSGYSIEVATDTSGASFDANGYNVTLSNTFRIDSNTYSPTVRMGEGVWTLGNVLYFFKGTVYPETATIIFTGTSTGSAQILVVIPTINGSFAVVNPLNVVSLRGPMTIDSLAFTGTSNKTLELGSSGSTCTIKAINFNQTGTNTITITQYGGTVTTPYAILSTPVANGDKVVGTSVTVTGVNVQTGAAYARWYVGNNSSVASATTGWNLLRGGLLNLFS